MCYILRNGFMALAEEYKKAFFNTDTDEYFKMVSDYPSLLECFVQMYGIMVKENRITPIERLSADEKLQLWNEAKRIAGETSTKEHCIRLSKALHFLGTLIQE